VFNSLSVTPKVTQRLTNGQPCVQGEETFVAIIADISDPDDARSAIVSYYSYTMKGGPSGGGQMGPDGAPPPVYGSFFAPTHGTIPESGGTIVVTVSARDPAGNVVSTTRNVTVDQCIIIT